MNSKAIVRHLAVLLLFAFIAFPWGNAAANGGPRLGEPGMGATLDKSGDETLQRMIREVAPKFRQLEYSANGMSMRYSLFSPENPEPGKKYPLVLFIADASTPGADVKSPLLQGYGGLVWASPEAQAKNPCHVLVPQFSGVAVNDAYEHTPEADFLVSLLGAVVKENAVDASRLYATGQSMGGMLAMYYNIKYPRLFAASLFVDCHWDRAGLDRLVERPFIMVYAGNSGKSRETGQAIEEAARRMGRSYTWAEWSARLPLERQDELAATQLEKGQPINLFGFEPGSVLPESGRGSEHMYSFDCAYRLAPARNWLFGHALKPGNGKN